MINLIPEWAKYIVTKGTRVILFETKPIFKLDSWNGGGRWETIDLLPKKKGEISK